MTDPACAFCSPPDDRLFHRGRLVLGLWDQFPVSPGHALIIPRRHVASWFEATDEERVELMAVVADARAAIERVHQPDGYNLYTGDEKAPEADVLFASIQTLGRTRHLGQFSPDAFDYIVVDEFHHAAATTYRRLINHFQPRFLLGLTATPERTDGGDLLALCGENLVFRYDLWDGIRRGLLTPFHYFGVPDEVDYLNIPWRSTRFDEEALTRAVATQSRAQNALEQYRLRAGACTLAFCCSTRHADFMADFFTEAGVRAVAVHSDATSAPRAVSLERSSSGRPSISSSSRITRNETAPASRPSICDSTLLISRQR